MFHRERHPKDWLSGGIPYAVNQLNWSAFPFHTLFLVRLFFLGWTSYFVAVAVRRFPSRPLHDWAFYVEGTAATTFEVLAFEIVLALRLFWPPVVFHFRSFCSRLFQATSTDKHRTKLRYHLDLRRCCGCGFLLSAVRVFWPGRPMRLRADPVEWHCRANHEHISAADLYPLAQHTFTRARAGVLGRVPETGQGYHPRQARSGLSLLVYTSGTELLICRSGGSLPAPPI